MTAKSKKLKKLTKEDVEKIIKDIKSLKIQGARNVAIASLNTLANYSDQIKTKNPNEFYKQLMKVKEKLEHSRPTEPMLRNVLREVTDYLYSEIKTTKDLNKVKTDFREYCEFLLQKIHEDKEKLTEYGAALIPNDALVITHCHSSTVVSILKKAKKRKKKFSVVACETRPRYQGRITASELAEAGIDVTLIVDGAVTRFMKKADIVLVGADSITSRGDLINKIGTSTIAHIARMHDVSFYSAAELFKYSSLTIYGKLEKIEERPGEEVWENPPKGVKISNPAFEATAAKYINGYITEVGVIPPQSFFSLATQKMGIKIY